MCSVTRVENKLSSRYGEVTGQSCSLFVKAEELGLDSRLGDVNFEVPVDLWSLNGKDLSLEEATQLIDPTTARCNLTVIHTMCMNVGLPRTTEKQVLEALKNTLKPSSPSAPVFP